MYMHSTLSFLNLIIDYKNYITGTQGTIKSAARYKIF